MSRLGLWLFGTRVQGSFDLYGVGVSFLWVQRGWETKEKVWGG